MESTFKKGISKYKKTPMLPWYLLNNPEKVCFSRILFCQPSRRSFLAIQPKLQNIL